MSACFFTGWLKDSGAKEEPNGAKVRRYEGTKVRVRRCEGTKPRVPGCEVRRCEGAASQDFTSWNQIAGWLKRLGALRVVA